jgi:hypothetical protein
MSDTPETDAFMTRIRGIDGDKHWVPANTSRRLERERDEARHEIEGWRNKWECAVEMAARAENERDDLRDRLNELLNRPTLV